jgi:hypothetical protein
VLRSKITGSHCGEPFRSAVISSALLTIATCPREERRNEAPDDFLANRSRLGPMVEGARLVIFGRIRRAAQCRIWETPFLATRRTLAAP